MNNILPYSKLSFLIALRRKRNNTLQQAVNLDRVMYRQCGTTTHLSCNPNTLDRRRDTQAYTATQIQHAFKWADTKSSTVTALHGAPRS
ncbi:hypothetical protein BaRGS_00037826 [Batillaria attramentaria]|uniref:Uncharacterized protein n=1 Tax=Batillaria attramentaria TaxID=370345 RepID=A0ABD0J7J4_9CAEN